MTRDELRGRVMGVQVWCSPKYGPDIEDEGQRFHCLATGDNGQPCENITTLFYRPSNSHLCQYHIDKSRGKRTPTPNTGETDA